MEIINGIDQDDISVTDTDHNDLDGLNTGDYKHLTSANHADLTDSGVCSIHKHDIVGDLTPQLGGNLDMQTNKLVGEGGSVGIYIDSNGYVGIGTITPQDELDIVGKIAIDGTSRVYFPDQTDFLGTMYLGNGDGGASLSHGEGNNGRYNSFIGVGSGNTNTTGYSNTADGYRSLHANTTGYSNTACGYRSLYTNTTGYYNTADGHQSLFANTTGYYNTANGMNSLYANTTGHSNTACGYQSLNANTTGNSNTADGMYSLRANTTGYSNTANGMNSLYTNTTGYSNTANGYRSLYTNTTGISNTACGYQSIFANTTGNSNTANGMSAINDLGSAQTAGAFNIGTSYTIKTTGDTNFTLIGAADNNVGTVFTATGAGAGTGTATPNGTNNNTAIGYSAGRGIIYGKANTIVGANVTGLPAGLSNNIILADGDGNKRINVDEDGDVGIGTTTPTAKLDVNSDILRLRTAKTPATSGADGNQGDIAWDANYLYVCTATNTWKRSGLSTW